MAQLPGWIRTVGWMRGEDGEARIIVAIRWWHPAAWLAVVRVAGDWAVSRIVSK